MARPRAQTLQQKLGFYDEDLKKPDHDMIMQWVSDNAEGVLNSVFGLSSFGKNEVDEIKNQIIVELNEN